MTDEAFMPGQLTEIPQAAHTYRYLTMDYSEYRGLPPPLTNGGLNENNVAGRDVWSPSRPELVEMTPTNQTGPQYSDLSRIAMERARTAREAVEIIGALIDEHGYSTYGGNSHMFADENEGWVLLNFAGGQGLWIAERLGPDDITDVLSRATSTKSRWTFRTATITWARKISSVSQQNKAGSTRAETSRSTSRRSTVLMKSAIRAVTWNASYVPQRRSDLRAMMDAVRDPRISKDSTGYGQVAALTRQRPPGVESFVDCADRISDRAIHSVPDRRAGNCAAIRQAPLPDQGRGRRFRHR